MNDLNRALVDIREIRRQVAQTSEFRGYGPLTLGATAVCALIAGVLQSRLIRDPALQPGRYVAVWLSNGVFCAGLIAVQMFARARRLHSFAADAMIRAAVAQFLPAAAAGFVLPFVLLHVRQDVLWMLPGLWQMIFSLGVFASNRSLPRTMLVVGGWFLITGLGSIALGDGRALAPLTMAAPFAIGMALVAGIHAVSAKRVGSDEEEDL